MRRRVFLGFMAAAIALLVVVLALVVLPGGGQSRNVTHNRPTLPGTALPEGTQASTSLAPSPSSETGGVQVALAALPVTVLDISGAQVGDGTLRLYAPDRASYPQTSRVELELHMDHRYVTPTPAGPVEITPLPHVTSTPPPGRLTPTPRVPIYEESGQEVYLRMGASLRCLPSSFEGCEDGYNRSRLRSLGTGTTTWVWNIKPQANVTGAQDLQVEVWTLEVVQNVEVPTVRWQHAFQIEVNPGQVVTPKSQADGGGGIGVLTVILIVMAVVAVMNGVVLAIWFVRRLRRPKIFISYQRRTGWSMAQNVRDRLRASGASVFLDVEDIHEGRFGQIIEQEIAQRDHFVAVLAPGTLDSEWVCREIETAIRYGKNVVPLLVDGFRFEDVTLSKEIRALAGYNAIRVDPEFFDAAMSKLAVFVKLKTPKLR